VQRVRRVAKVVNPQVNLSVQYVAANDEEKGQWQVLVDGKEIGYYPDGIFQPNGLHPKRAAWWGEVGTVQSCSKLLDGSSCTAMGNGKLGSDPAAVGFSNMAVVGGSVQPKQMHVTNRELYSSDQYGTGAKGDVRFDGDSFHYGGPGYCQAKPHGVRAEPAEQHRGDGGLALTAVVRRTAVERIVLLERHGSCWPRDRHEKWLRASWELD
jgi:hypothetical protein